MRTNIIVNCLFEMYDDDFRLKCIVILFYFFFLIKFFEIIVNDFFFFFNFAIYDEIFRLTRTRARKYRIKCSSI